VANRGTNNNYSPGIIEITSSSCCPEISNFTKPVGLAFDTSGNLWVIDAGNSTTVEITKPAIDSASCTAQTPCYQYSLPAVPVGVVTDSLGNIWISLASAKVIVYKP
jgi:sugar lactone lactonase YvrE